MAAFVQSRPASVVMSTTVVGTMDDASMWVRDPVPKEDRASGRRTEGACVAGGKLWRRGKNVNLPVCNSTETVGVRRLEGLGEDVTNILRVAEVLSPSTVLCKANTSTIRARWKDWCTMSPTGAGERVDPNRVIDTALACNDNWNTFAITQDNLGLNHLIVGFDEKEIVKKLASGECDAMNSDTLLSLSCAAHSVVLCTQSVTTKLDQLPSVCVRMGHLHENGRVTMEHEKAI
jgi:hypothetical protein